jgi:hypothetical protein
VGLADLLGELLVFGFEAFAAEGALEEHFDLVEVEGFGDEVPGTTAHGFDGGVDGAIGGHHDGDGGLWEGEGGIQQVHSRIASEAEVGEEEVDGFGFEDGEGFGVSSGGVDVEFLFEGAAEAFACGAFVFDDEEGGEHGVRDGSREFVRFFSRGR